MGNSNEGTNLMRNLNTSASALIKYDNELGFAERATDFIDDYEEFGSFKQVYNETFKTLFENQLSDQVSRQIIDFVENIAPNFAKAGYTPEYYKGVFSFQYVKKGERIIGSPKIRASGAELRNQVKTAANFQIVAKTKRGKLLQQIAAAKDGYLKESLEAQLARIDLDIQELIRPTETPLDEAGNAIASEVSNLNSNVPEIMDRITTENEINEHGSVSSFSKTDTPQAVAENVEVANISTENTIDDLKNPILGQ